MSIAAHLKKLFPLVALALACQAAAHAQPVRVGYWTSGVSLGYGALLEGRKFLENEGLDVQYVKFPDVNGPTKALASGAIDFAFANSAAGAFSLAAQGVPIKIVLATQLAEVQFVTLEDSGITSLADLAGKKVGMSPPGSAVASLAAAVLEANHGLKPGTFSLVPGNESRLAQFLVQKDVDAAALRSVTIAQLPEVKLRKLSSFAQEWQAMTKTDGLPYIGVGVVRSDYLKEHPDAVAKVIAGMRKALEYGSQHTDEVAQLLEKTANMPPADARAYAGFWDDIYRVTMEPVDIQTLNRMFEIFKASGSVQGTLPDDAIDTAPYEASKAIK